MAGTPTVLGRHQRKVFFHNPRALAQSFLRQAAIKTGPAWHLFLKDGPQGVGDFTHGWRPPPTDREARVEAQARCGSEAGHAEPEGPVGQGGIHRVQANQPERIAAFGVLAERGSVGAAFKVLLALILGETCWPLGIGQDSRFKPFRVE